MNTDQKILKAILMLRRWGNKYQTKEEQIAEQHRWLEDDPTYAERLDEWIDSLRIYEWFRGPCCLEDGDVD